MKVTGFLFHRNPFCNFLTQKNQLSLKLTQKIEESEMKIFFENKCLNSFCLRRVGAMQVKMEWARLDVNAALVQAGQICKIVFFLQILL